MATGLDEEGWLSQIGSTSFRCCKLQIPSASIKIAKNYNFSTTMEVVVKAWSCLPDVQNGVWYFYYTNP